MARGVHGTGHFAQVPGNHDQAEPHAVYADTPAFIADIERQNQAVKTLMPKLNLKQ